MNWLVVLAFAAELGMMPNNNWYLYESQDVAESPGYYTDLSAEIQWGPLFAGGTVRTDVTPNNASNYNPHWTTYDFGAGVRLEPFEFGWRHLCTHPIQTYDRDLGPLVEGAVDEFYARVKVEVDL